MKTSFEKFMASSAVKSVELSDNKVELGEMKVELARDMNALIKAADQFIFEDMKVQSKAISLLNEAQKVLASANADPKPLLDEYQELMAQLSKLGVEIPKPLSNSFTSFRRDAIREANMKKQVLAKLFEIDKIFGGKGI